MKQDQFDLILKSRLESIKNVLGGKAQEYAINDDRLHNFKVAARIAGNTPREALWGMAMKHLVCVDDMIKGHTTPTPYLINEKLGDMINYLVLLEAVLIEQIWESH